MKIIRERKKYREGGYSWIEPAVGICINCGNEVELIDEYLGACQCQNCGEWYNMSGQHLLPPDEWEDY